MNENKSAAPLTSSKATDPKQKGNSRNETDGIMEKLMNRLISSNKLLEDESTDRNVARLKQNKTFKRLMNN